MLVHHFHGTATRIAVEATAFGIRRPNFVIEIMAAWDPDDDPAPHHPWADAVSTDLAVDALPGPPTLGVSSS